MSGEAGHEEIPLIGLENTEGDLTQSRQKAECWISYAIVTSSLELKAQSWSQILGNQGHAVYDCNEYCSKAYETSGREHPGKKERSLKAKP